MYAKGSHWVNMAVDEGAVWAAAIQGGPSSWGATMKYDLERIGFRGDLACRHEVISLDFLEHHIRETCCLLTLVCSLSDRTGHRTSLRPRPARSALS